MKKHVQLRHAWGLEGSCIDFCSGHSLKALHATDRIVDLINLCWQFHAKCMEPVHSLVVDVSQDAERKAWSLHHFPTLTTSSELFFYKRSRALVGQEYLAILGFDIHTLALPVSHSQMKDLAGDAMSPACIGLVSAACLAILKRSSP